jgi:hypothetical protein
MSLCAICPKFLFKIIGKYRQNNISMF